ncbi:MAG: thiol:disulfide interchange protein DsbD [Pirellulaceae bacterium]|nr:MAG: thiol:disulfide interchange protein DsbD [Pirellulaceae bacterium]
MEQRFASKSSGGSTRCFFTNTRVNPSRLQAAGDAVTGYRGKAQRWLSPVAMALLWTLLASMAAAQKKFEGLGLPTVPSFGGLGAETAPVSEEPELSYDAHFSWDQRRAQGVLHVTATPGEGSHTYSMNQSKGPLPTRIRIESDHVELIGPWQADHEPMIGFDEAAFPGIPLEEYHSRVTWSAPFRFKGSVDPATAKIKLRVDGLVCSVACKPVHANLLASWMAPPPAPTASESDTAGESNRGLTNAASSVAAEKGFRVERTHALWKAAIVPGQVAAGQFANVIIECHPDPGYHIWQFVPLDDEPTNRTLIVATVKSGLQFGTPTTDAPLVAYDSLPGRPQYYATPVKFEIPVFVPPSTKPGVYPIEIQIGFGTCDDRSCDPPAGLILRGELSVGVDRSTSPAPMQFETTSFRNVAMQPLLTSWITAGESLAQPPVMEEPEVEVIVEAPPGAEPSAQQSFSNSSARNDSIGTSGAPDASQGQEAGQRFLSAWQLFLALAGGFILNFMPCVLPVIGLKIMSFVDQAGHQRGRIVTLNLAFVAGIMAVMLSLAAVTIVAKLLFQETVGWGEQFTVLEFKVALAALVFAMALSFLGVWEIPIPGFATGSQSGRLMEKEGVMGAFLKGILTTLLATPCSGPLLGSLFGISLILSPLGILQLYTAVGLGMSIPYLALCVYPHAVNLLPKPGPWMETLKQVLAFPLLFTVVFFVASIQYEYRIATLTFLIVVWMACWLVGRVPVYAESMQKSKAWIAAIAVMIFGGFISFKYFGPLEHDLEWVPYSESELIKLRQEGKTVMIDFTANWCVNCQINMRMAIDREAVAQLVEQYDVVPMVADWTSQDEAIGKKLEELGSNSIPVLAIYPADPAAEPIVLRDLLTETQVLEALREAGPSRNANGWLTSHVD